MSNQEIEIVKASEIDWRGRGRRGSGLATQVRRAIEHLDRHPDDAVIVTIPEGVTVRTSAAISAQRAFTARPGEFRVNKVSDGRFAIGRRPHSAVTP